jgi:glucan-binding repeat-containing protein
MYRERRFPGIAAGLILFFLMIAAVPLQTKAAWVENSDGTYSYYSSSGTLAVNQWIKNTYYVNARGVRQTGWMYKEKKWYYFNKKGEVQKSIWFTSGSNRYYAGKDGAVYTSGRYLIGKYYYAFNARGQMLTGMQEIDGETYYFKSSNGRMQTQKWIKSGKYYYYFGETGAMAKSTWIGRYYVNSKGKRLSNTWKGNKYLGSDGMAVSGIQEIDGVYYYFSTKTYKMLTSSTVKVDGITYKFDSSGKGTIVSSTKNPATTVKVESSYYSDPYVEDEAFLAAIIYCEAGNQSYAGQQAVGMVIMNRVYTNGFPNSMREVVYAKQQFEPARNGTLTRALKDDSIVTESCKQAARSVLEQYKNYTTGKNR